MNSIDNRIDFTKLYKGRKNLPDWEARTRGASAFMRGFDGVGKTLVRGLTLNYFFSSSFDVRGKMRGEENTLRKIIETGLAKNRLSAKNVLSQLTRDVYPLHSPFDENGFSLEEARNTSGEKAYVSVLHRHYFSPI